MSQQNVQQKDTVVFVRSTQPESDSRLTKAVQAVLKQGWKVVILGWNRKGTPSSAFLEFGDLRAEVRMYEHPHPHGTGIKGIVKTGSYAGWAYRQLVKLRDRIAVVHACDLDAGLPGMMFCRSAHCKMVYDIYDYYVASRRLPARLKPFVESLEVRVINHADATIICTEERKAQIRKASPKKLYTIYNSPSIEMLPPAEEFADWTSAEQRRFRLCYVGVLSDVRLLRQILNEIGSHPEMELHIGGIGPLEAEVEQAGKTLDNVFYYGKMAYTDVLALESRSDLLFAVYDPAVKGHQFSAPNKVYEAMALGKPVVVCRGTSIDELVGRHEIGEICTYDAADFFRACETLRSDRTRYGRCSSNSKMLYSQYSWMRNEEELKKIYQSL